MRRIATLFLLFGLTAIGAHAQEAAGLISVESKHDVPTTTEKFVAAAEEKGLKVFNRIDHAAGAQSVGMSVPPTELVIFGNPEIGTALMKCGPTVAIDLPLKALIWQDSEGVVRVSYNDPTWLVERHGLAGCEPVVEKVSGALAGLAETATH
jgi:uncharacterized protein (DUF302 family)